MGNELPISASLALDSWIKERRPLEQMDLYFVTNVMYSVLIWVSSQSLYRAPRPRPATPLAIPVPPLVLLVVPPRVGIPPRPPALGMPPLPLGTPDVFVAGAGVCGVWNLDDILLLGGLSTNEVSVVRNVASMSSGPCERLRFAAPPSGWF